MVEIFKTNVKNKKLANSVIKALNAGLPACSFNFDLDDCDRILRAQSAGKPIEVKKIIEIVEQHAVEVCVFED